MRKSHTIFILDKDTGYITPLIQSLRNSGFNVVCWEENQKAIDIVKELKADLIISEVNLPTIDSHIFFKELRAIPEFKTTPFIFLSSEKKVDDRIKNIEVGIDDYIAKPYYVEEVVSRIKNLLNEINGLEESQTETEKGFTGNLTEMNLVDLIQTLELGRKSAVIKLKHHSIIGTVYISKGQAFDAVLEDLPPEKAIMRMFTWTIGSFFVDIIDVKKERKINIPNKDLIEIGIRRINNWEQIKQGLPSLNAMVIKTEHNNSNGLTVDEKEVLSGLTEKIRLCDFIENSRFDDLKALEIVRGLNQKGYLQEAEDNYSHYVDEYLTKLKHNHSHHLTPSERAVSMVSNLFKKSSEDTKYFERRKNERRQITDRRNQGRRLSDRLRQSNPVYLSKTELLMLKEALL